MNKTLVSIIFAIFAALISACPSPPPDNNKTAASNGRTTEELAVKTAAPDYQWVQLGDGGAVIARAIFKQSGQNCPNIETTAKDDKKASVAMQTRKTQNMPPDFAVTVCEAAITDADKLASATLGGKNLALPTKSPKRIAVIGDTGCRVKGSDIQNCNNDPKYGDQWHFVKTANDAVALKPDLVIHVGDYIYRESDCSDAAKCGNSPHGDNLATWEVDFLSPAKPLLEAVPWVFARGNHETCGDQTRSIPEREWRGWYLFLDPRPLTDTTFTNCVTTSAPFNVTLDSLDLLVLDSSNEGDLNGYNQTAVENLKGSNPVWLVTHVPLYGINHYNYTKPDQPSNGVKNAIKNSTVKFLVSGHIHLFEMLLFPDRPPQMIAGGGATELDPKVTNEQFNQGLNIIGATGKDKNDPNKPASEIIDKFTFSYIDVGSDSWKVTVVDQDGTKEKATYAVKK